MDKQVRNVRKDGAMYISVRTAYGLCAMSYLAWKGPCKMKEIAETQNIPLNYLVKVMQNLSRAGLVRVGRGPRGGVSLLRSPASINMRQVVEAMEGPIHLNGCPAVFTDERRAEACLAQQTWKRIEEMVLRELERVTINDLGGCPSPGMSPVMAIRDGHDGKR